MKFSELIQVTKEKNEILHKLVDIEQQPQLCHLTFELKTLLDDPQPGLMTWISMVVESLKRLTEYKQRNVDKLSTEVKQALLSLLEHAPE